ncbi:hypothetical protein Tco_0363049, partial [Tanacetum coccineum]
VDAFACPTSFPWNTGKSASKDPFSKPSQYNAERYATLVAYPAPFHKYPEPFLCLIGISRNYTLDEDTYPQFLRDNDEEIDLLSFIRTVDPTKVRVGERQRAKGEPKLLDTTVGHVVLLLPVAPTRASSELEASVEKLFDEGGSGSHTERGDSVSGGHGVDIPQVSATAEIVAEDAAPVEDHVTSTGPSVAGKSKSALQRLLVGAMLNPEVGIVALPILPFITSSVSMTPEREDGNQSDFMARANLRTITAPPRFVISSDSSHHSGANIAEAEVDSFARPSVPLMTMATSVTPTIGPNTTAKERFVEPSIFGGGSSSGAEHTIGGFSCLTGSDFIVGGICTVVSPDTDLRKVAKVRMHAEFNIREKRRLCSVVEEKYSLLKARDEEIRSLKDEIKSLKERNTTLEKEKGVLDVKVADLAATVKVREQEAADSDAMVTTVKLQNDRLADQVRELETSSSGLQEKVVVYENCRVLANVAAFNPSEEEDFTSDLQEVQNVNFSLLLELQSNKDASVETSDQTVIGARALSLSLDVSHGRVQRIREKIANNRSALRVVFVSFSEPLSAAALEGTGGTSSVAPDITTTLSVTLASASTIPPISMDDYKIAHAEDQGNAGADVDPFLNVDDTELIISY